MNAIETPTENLTLCQPTTIRKFCTKAKFLPCEILRFEKTQKIKRKFSLYKVLRGKKTENEKSDVCGKKSLKGTLTCTELF